MDSDKTLQKLQRELAASQAQLAQTVAEKQRLEGMSRHLNFLDDALDGFFFTDERNEVLFVNLFLLRLLGYSDEERTALLGAPLLSRHWVEPDERERIKRHLEQYGYIRDKKVELVALSDTPLLVSLSAVATRDAEGKTVGAQYMLRPLPYASRRGTAELRAENRELAALTSIGRTVLSTMNIDEVAQHLIKTVMDLFEVDIAWLYLKQKDGTLQLVAYKGLDEEGLARIRVGAMTQVTQFGSIQERLVLARRLGFTDLAPAVLMAHERMIGLLVIASHSARLLVESNIESLERIAQYAGLALSNAMLYDDLEHAYEELKHAQAQLVDAERQKVAVEMAGAAAHELNQPLTVLLGYSNLLVRNMKEDDPQKMILQKIEVNTRKVSEIVARLGQITRYRTREYVEGQPIVDIEAASRPEQDEEK